jgi:protoporphyrinogen oxidase
MWDPLLRSKLGAASKETSAAFIWATIKRLYGTRQKGSKKEMMGCVKGGYHSILAHARMQIEKQGVSIQTGWPVKRVSAEGNGIRVEGENGQSLRFDEVIATVPNPVINQIMPDLPEDFQKRLDSVQYLGVVCMTLVLDRSLSPFYVTNILDRNLPFTGLIEASHVIPPSVLDGKRLVYLPRYLVAGDAVASFSDDEVAKTFIEALKRMFPWFSENEIQNWKINRERYVQPVYSIGYSENLAPIRTPIDNFFMVNTSMILNSTLNNNQVIQLAKEAAQTVKRQPNDR